MRTSLLINCSKKEAQEVRTRAELQRRTVSGYVMNIVVRRIQFAEEIPGMNPPVFRLERGKRAKAAGPRTTLHIYCSLEDARKIRRAARLGQVTISGFVLHCLSHAWQVEDALAEIQRKKGIHRHSPLNVPN